MTGKSDLNLPFFIYNFFEDLMLRSLLISAGLIFPCVSYGFTYVAMGDSISAGTNAETQSLRSEYAWVDGPGLERNFIQAMGPGLERHYNASVPGALSAMLHVQSYVVEWMQANYVTITIGGNDFAWGQGHELVPNLRKITQRLSANEYVKRIFVSTVPDLEQIYQLGNSQETCRRLHVLAPLFLMAPDSQRLKIAAEIHQANEQIVELAREFPKLTVVTTVTDRAYGAADISQVDCIHPSRLGQQNLADGFTQAFLRTEVAR
jgi:lysophospholipase L1-like esterase